MIMLAKDGKCIGDVDSMAQTYAHCGLEHILVPYCRYSAQNWKNRRDNWISILPSWERVIINDDTSER
jgi:hypothetical protein